MIKNFGYIKLKVNDQYSYMLYYHCCGFLHKYLHTNIFLFGSVISADVFIYK